MPGLPVARGPDARAVQRPPLLALLSSRVLRGSPRRPASGMPTSSRSRATCSTTRPRWAGSSRYAPAPGTARVSSRSWATTTTGSGPVAPRDSEGPGSPTWKGMGAAGDGRRSLAIGGTSRPWGPKLDYDRDSRGRLPDRPEPLARPVPPAASPGGRPGPRRPQPRRPDPPARLRPDPDAEPIQPPLRPRLLPSGWSMLYVSRGVGAKDPIRYGCPARGHPVRPPGHPRDPVATRERVREWGAEPEAMRPGPDATPPRSPPGRVAGVGERPAKPTATAGGIDRWWVSRARSPTLLVLAQSSVARRGRGGWHSAQSDFRNATSCRAWSGCSCNIFDVSVCHLLGLALVPAE